MLCTAQQMNLSMLWTRACMLVIPVSILPNLSVHCKCPHLLQPFVDSIRFDFQSRSPAYGCIGAWDCPHSSTGAVLRSCIAKFSHVAPLIPHPSLYIYPIFCTTESSGSARTEERPTLASTSSSLSDIIATLSPLMTYSPNGTVSGSASGLYTLSEASFKMRF